MMFLRAVVVYLVVCGSAFAQVGQIPSWPPVQPGSAAPITFSLTFPSASSHQEEASGLTIITYSSLDIGATDPNRYVVVAIGSRMATVNTISSVTINGVSANLVSGTVAQFGGTNGANSAFYISSVPVPSGTTASVVVTYGAAAARTGVATYRLITGTPLATSSDAKNSAGTITNGTLTIPSGGKGIAFDFQSSSTSTPVWVNATSDYAAIAGGSSEMGSATVLATSSAISAGINVQQVMSLAAWGP